MLQGCNYRHVMIDSWELVEKVWKDEGVPAPLILRGNEETFGLLGCGR